MNFGCKMKKLPIKNSLPSGWARISIADTGEYINGFAFKPSHREAQGLPIIRIQNLTDESKPLNRTTLKDVLHDIDKNTAYKDTQYWQLFEAIESFLYGELDMESIHENGIY